MSAPDKPRLRWHELISWMESEGISRHVVTKMIKAGLIKGRPLFKGDRDYYYPSEIQPVLDKHSYSGNGH